MKYQEQNPFRAAGGGGGFNPVSEPDVARSLERELRQGERREDAYYESRRENDQTIIDNANQKVDTARLEADKANEEIDKNLKNLSAFSKTVTKIANQRIIADVTKKVQDAAMTGYLNEPYAEQQTREFEEGESAVEEGQQQMNELAARYESEGGSPIVGEQLRTSFTGRERVAYERGRMLRLTEEYPLFVRRMEQGAPNGGSWQQYINATKDPGVRTERQNEAVSEFLRRTGASGTNMGLMNKYLLREIRKLNTDEELKWVQKTEEDILTGRLQRLDNEFYIAAGAGDIAGAATRFMEQAQSYGVSGPDAKKRLFDLLKNNERKFLPSDIEALAGADATGHPGCPKNGDPCTFGKVYAAEIDGLKFAVANNLGLNVETAIAQRKAEQGRWEEEVQQEIAQMRKDGRDPTYEELESLREKTRGMGLDPGFLADYQTGAEYSLESAKRFLESLYQKQGYITQNDLDGLPTPIANDREVKEWLETGNARSGETKDQQQALKDSIKRISDELALSSTDDVRGIVYDRISNGVRQDVMAEYNANIQSPKYRNENGSINYDQARADAVEKVYANAKKIGETEGKDYTQGSTEVERATRGNARYNERVNVMKKQLQADPKFLTNSLFSSPDELEQARKALNNQGNYPPIYEDLAAGQINITPYDIAQAQLAQAKVKIHQQPVEQAVKNQSPEIQRLLNYKPNLNRTERAFNPNNNAPGTVDPMSPVYTTGNIGPTSTGQHLDVKRTDGSYFEYKDLDPYVLVDDKDLGQRIPLSRVPETGDWNSHTVRGSHGRDYGTYSGSSIYLVNGARVIDTVPTVHGDRLQIELPDGRRFFFLHGTSQPVRVLPKSQPTAPTSSGSGYSGPAVLDRNAISSTLTQAGWPANLIPRMTAVALAESGGRVGIDSSQSGLDPNRVNEYSIGLLQVNYKVHKQLVHSMGYTEQDLRDPVKNARVALRIYQSQGITAWGAYTNGSYRQHL